MSYVSVIGKNKQPCNPCHPAVACQLLKQGKAAVFNGNRQMCRMDAYGFPRTGAKAGKKFFGYETGDIVRAVVTKGKKRGTYVGKVAVRESGYFNIISHKRVQGINHVYCKQLHARDGYMYNASASSAL